MAQALSNQQLHLDPLALGRIAEGKGIIVKHLLCAHAHPDGRQTGKIAVDRVH